MVKGLIIFIAGYLTAILVLKTEKEWARLIDRISLQLSIESDKKKLQIILWCVVTQLDFRIKQTLKRKYEREKKDFILEVLVKTYPEMKPWQIVSLCNQTCRDLMDNSNLLTDQVTFYKYLDAKEVAKLISRRIMTEKYKKA
jgi:hypothetical protein